MIDTTSIVTRDGKEYSVMIDGYAMPVHRTGAYRNEAGHNDDRTGYPVYREDEGDTIEPTAAEIEAAHPGVLL